MLQRSARAVNVFSPFAETSKNRTPDATTSARRWPRSCRCTVSPGGPPGPGGRWSGWRFDREQRTGAAGLKLHVTARRQRHRQNALIDLVQVDLDVGNSRRIAGLGRVGFRRIRLGAFGARRRGLFFVALGRERRRIGLRENRHVDAARHRAAAAPDVRLERGSRVSAGREVQVLAVLVEHGIAGVAQPVGQLGRLRVGERVRENRAEVILEPLAIHEPLAVRGPRRRPLAGRCQETILVDANRLLLLDVDVPRGEVGIDVGDLAAVGRPSWRGIKRRLVCEADLSRRLEPHRVTQVELVFAAFVGEVRDPLAVGRPGRVALDRRRSSRSGCAGRPSRRAQSGSRRALRTGRARPSAKCAPGSAGVPRSRTWAAAPPCRRPG